MTTNLGALPAALDEMPAQDAFALLAWWRDHPPVAEILAAVHRITPALPPDPDDPSGIGALIRRGGEKASISRSIRGADGHDIQTL